MKTRIAFAGLFIALLPATAFAAPATPYAAVPAHKSAKAAATVYECQTCHMRVTAAQAKKSHYKDAMDGGKLIAVPSAHK